MGLYILTLKQTWNLSLVTQHTCVTLVTLDKALVTPGLFVYKIKYTFFLLIAQVSLFKFMRALLGRIIKKKKKYLFCVKFVPNPMPGLKVASSQSWA